MDAAIKSRVPQIIFLYWVIKIASTTLGETGADMFSMTFNLGYLTTVAIFMAFFLIFFRNQTFLERLSSVSLLADLYRLGDRGEGDIGFYRSYSENWIPNGFGCFNNIVIDNSFYLVQKRKIDQC